MDICRPAVVCPGKDPHHLGIGCMVMGYLHIMKTLCAFDFNNVTG